MPSHSPDPGQAAKVTPEARGARPDDVRTALLARIVNARVPHRSLCLLLLEVEGLGCFTDAALRRMSRILDILENNQLPEGECK